MPYRLIFNLIDVAGKHCRAAAACKTCEPQCNPEASVNINCSLKGAAMCAEAGPQSFFSRAQWWPTQELTANESALE